MSVCVFGHLPAVLGFGGAVTGVILAVGEHTRLGRTGVVDDGMHRIVMDEAVMPELGCDAVVELLPPVGSELVPKKESVEASAVAATVVGEELPEVVEGGCHTNWPDKKGGVMADECQRVKGL